MSAPVLPARGALARYTGQRIPESYVPPVAPDDEEESLRGILRVLRKRKYWIALSALGGLTAAILLLLVLPPQYVGLATVEIGKGANASPNLLHDEAPSASGADELKTDLTTQMAVMSDNSIALAVVRDLNLENYKPFIFKPSLMGWVNGENARIQAERGLPLDKAPATRERLLNIFSRKLTVKNLPDTRLVTVAFKNPDPQLAADVANDVVNQYIRYESRSQATGPASQWLDAQLSQLKTNFERSQQRLADFEKQNGLNSLLLSSAGQGGGAGASTHIPVVDRLDTLNQALTSAESNRVAKEAIYKLTQTQNPEVVIGLGASSLPGMAGSSVLGQGNGLDVLQNLRQQQSQLQLQYADLLTRDGARNPHVLEIKSQQQAIQEQIAEELAKINTRAKNDYLLAKQNEAATREAFNQAQADASRLNESAVRLQVLTEEAASSRQLYEGLYGKLQEANVQAGIQASDITVADPARSTTVPWPPRAITMGLGFAAGLLFGLSSAFVREHLDDTVKTPLEIAPVISLPVLASLPYAPFLPKRSSNGGSLSAHVARTDEMSPLITQPGSPVSEAYRALRTSILLSSPDGHLRTILVSSPLVGEGKSTVAYNTGVAFAHAGRRVLLIDADLRNPRLHDLFGVAKSPGISEALGNGQSVEAVIRTHATIPNLSLLPAGSKPLMPSELLGGRRFTELLEAFKEKYDLVILDSPPILLVADAVELSGKVDATLCVIRAGVTNRTAIERVSEILERNGSYAVGLVLNAVDMRSVDSYYAFGHRGDQKYYEDHYA